MAHWPSHASWSLDESSQPHEAQLLKLDISKAKARLKWAPRWDLNKAMQTIIEWHFAWVNGEDMKAFSLNQIRDFEKFRIENCLWKAPDFGITVFRAELRLTVNMDN